MLIREEQKVTSLVVCGHAVDTIGLSQDNTLYQKYRNASQMSGLLPIGKVIGGESSENLMSIFWSITKNDYKRFQELSREGDDFIEWRNSLIDFWPQLESYLSQINNKDQFTFATYNDVQMNPTDWVSPESSVIYIGDYSHGTSPQLGQGAGLALIDSFILHECLVELQSGQLTSLQQCLAEYCKRRSSHVIGYRLASRILTPFFQSNYDTVSYFRDIVMGPMCKISPSRWFMLRTLAGIQSGWYNTFPTAPTF